MPCCRSESAKAAISAASNWRRGWNGLASIWSTGMYNRSEGSNEPGSYPPSSRPSRASRPRPSRRLGLFTVDHLQDQFGIGPRAPRPGTIVEHALAVARGLADADVAGDHGPEDRLREIAPYFIGYLVGQVQRGVEHRQDDPADLEPVVVPRL